MNIFNILNLSDANDAVRGRDGYQFDGQRLRCEIAKGDRNGGRDGGRDGGKRTHTIALLKYRITFCFILFYFICNIISDKWKVINFLIDNSFFFDQDLFIEFLLLTKIF